MRRLVLLVTAITFALSPATAGADDQPIKDSWITSKTKMSFITDGRVKARRIKVETDAGIVTLRGKVSTEAERNAAQRIARKIGGVKAVSNTLQVVPDTQRKKVDTRDARLASTVRARIKNGHALRTASIDVRADNAVVTLTGTVRDVHGLARAGGIVRGVPGVKAVRNELRQQS